MKNAEHISYFSDAERAAVARSRQWRTHLVRPIAAPLQKIGVTPNHLTYAGAAFFVPVAFFFERRPLLAIAFMAAGLIIDGIDGPYARVTGKTSASGAVADVLCDHIGLVVIVLCVIHYELAQPAVAAYYLLMYGLSVVVSIWQNALGVPVQLNLRSKYVIYLLYVLYVLAGLKVFTEAMIGFAVINTASAFVGYRRMRKHLRAQ